MIKILKEKRKGFSMLESVISVFILSLGIVAVMSLFVASLKNSIDSRDTVIAAELVQEGLELVRNVRDNNVASGGDGISVLPTSTTCRVSYNTAAITCDSNYNLNYSGGFYSGGGATTSRFQRRISINLFGTTGKTITSLVYWGGSLPGSCVVANKCTFAQAILMAR